MQVMTAFCWRHLHIIAMGEGLIRNANACVHSIFYNKVFVVNFEVHIH